MPAYAHGVGHTEPAQFFDSAKVHVYIYRIFAIGWALRIIYLSNPTLNSPVRQAIKQAGTTGWRN